ncbi:nitroreductase family deazaflavin-dependent oxidoreductase [Actinopolymorpha sp. B11F2]|uniref:nitroreductase family deazaflavin-dependent oxidoreductase n=1 Tax=Actinopolymorpha sp. B11F2 TaxID=3160862 RepID=UPI0032E4A61F
MSAPEQSIDDWNRQVIEEFRANDGKVGGYFAGSTLLLLTTTGAKSGRRRTSPLAALRDGDRLLVFGSNAGGPRHPAWYHNVLANPEVTVEFGTETYAATAVDIQGEEHDELYARQVKVAPVFGEYQEKTTRVIPVVALYRRDS